MAEDRLQDLCPKSPQRRVYPPGRGRARRLGLNKLLELIELPDDPGDRIQGVLVEPEKLEGVLDAYVDALERELRREFGFE
jgi:hypothetical protein